MKGIPAGKNRGKNVSTIKGGSPTKVVAGGPGKSFAQTAMPGPTSPGPPASMKKALARKAGPSKGI